MPSKTGPNTNSDSFVVYAENSVFEALQQSGANLTGFSPNKPSNLQKVTLTLPENWVVTGWQGSYRFLFDAKKRKRGFMCSAGGGTHLLKLHPWFSFSEGKGYVFNKVSKVAVQLKDGNGHLMRTAQSAPLLIDKGALSVSDGWNDAYRQLTTWLDEHYPHWKDPAAYWS